jgi:hypothetical protein
MGRQAKKLDKALRKGHASGKHMPQLGYDDDEFVKLLLYGEIEGDDFRAATQLAKSAGTWPTTSVRVVNIDQYRRLLPRGVSRIMRAQWAEALQEDTVIWLQELQRSKPDLLKKFLELVAQKEAEVERVNRTFSRPLSETTMKKEAFFTAMCWMNKGSPEFEAARYQAHAESSDKTPFSVIRDLCMTAALRNEAMGIGEGGNVLGVVGAAHRPRIRRLWLELSDADVSCITKLHEISGTTPLAWPASGALEVLKRTIEKELESDVRFELPVLRWSFTFRSSIRNRVRWEVRDLLTALEDPATFNSNDWCSVKGSKRQ